MHTISRVTLTYGFIVYIYYFITLSDIHEISTFITLIYLVQLRLNELKNICKVRVKNQTQVFL